jgi:hypothetical protein
MEQIVTKQGNVTLTETLYDSVTVNITAEIPELVGCVIRGSDGKWSAHDFKIRGSLISTYSKKAAISCLVAHAEKKCAESVSLPMSAS